VDVFFTISSLIGLAVQVFFALRIRLLSSRWELAIASWILALAQIGLSIVNVVTYSTKTLDFFLVASLTRSIVISIAASAFVMDSMTSAAYCYYMIRAEGKEKVGFRKYLLLLNESGTFAAVLSFVALVSSIRSTENFIWLGISFIRAKVVLNSVLVALNSRHLWRAPLPLVDVGKTPFLSSLHQSQRRNEIQVLGIQVDQSSIRYSNYSMSSLHNFEKSSVV